MQIWSLAHTTPDVSSNWDWAPDLGVRKAHISSFDVLSGGGPLPHSALVVGQTFEISCVGGYDDEDGCDVDVWQD